MAASGRQAAGGVEEAAEDPRILEPGAAPFGNFPHYSRFHPPEQRLRLLPPELLRRLFPPSSSETRPILGLDVGCNSGDFPRNDSKGVAWADPLAAGPSTIGDHRGPTAISLRNPGEE
nr:pre-miRNA 5'-monophosphate methyltransferase isoform X3 [Vulpes vulpes]